MLMGAPSSTWRLMAPQQTIILCPIPEEHASPTSLRGWLHSRLVDPWTTAMHGCGTTGLRSRIEAVRSSPSEFTMTDRAPNGVAPEAARRRTFAIISHPDAGKTTLT